MSFTYDPILGIALPPDLGESWGNEMRQSLSVLAAVSAPDNCYFVSPAFSDANLHNAAATSRRHFSTIQAAHDAIPTGSGVGHRPTIYLWPHEYAENLTITKTCALVARGARFGQGLGAGRGVSLIGANAQSPLVTINPPNGEALSFVCDGLHLENRYSGTAGAIGNGQVLRVTGQATFGANANYIALQDCDIRAQTWGPNNDWLAGLYVSGWNILNLRRMSMRGINYAGGAFNGGVAHMVMVIGDHANGKSATLRVVNCPIGQTYTGAMTTTNALFYLDGGASAVVSSSPGLYRQRAYAHMGTNGTNTISGIGTDLINGTPATAQAYCNVLGLDITGL